MRNHANRLTICTLIALAVVLSTYCTSTAAEKPPNFVLIFADDQGYQDVGCFGSPKIKTPALDRMAKEGRRFTDFYSAAPVCSASRAALMTGCYCARVGVTGVFFPNRSRQGLNPDEVTVAEVLKTRGYATACVGKWHLGDEKQFLPTRQGFDSYFGIPYSNDMSITRDGRRGPPLMRDEEIVEHPADQTTLTKRYTEEGVKFIRANKDGPFFLYLPHTMPHVPLFASEKFKDTSARGLYGDVIEEIDWSVGQILDTLRELDLAENTLVLFTSDNGPWLSKGKNGGCALPLRDGKFSTWEGGMREPCIMWWPGKVPADTTCSEVAATIDVLPTFAKLAGADVPRDRKIDGRDISKLISGNPDARSPHDTYFFRGQAVRAGKWKLHLKARDTVKKRPDQTFPALYDLSTDIGEDHNVATENPDVVDRLTKLLQQHNEEIAANKRPVGKMKKE
ncbi:MAG: sulfatase [Candidatus Nealsonbacteria bacterium]|nr:sulfatase [Candidatus Nealsonbacteria bacterium]